MQPGDGVVLTTWLAVLQPGIQPQPYGHDHHEGYEALRFFEIQGQGEIPRIFEKSNAPIRVWLAFVLLRQRVARLQMGG